MGFLSKLTGIFGGGSSAPKPVRTGKDVAPATAVGGTPQKAADDSVTPHRTLLIHGYSASGKEFEKWKNALGEKKNDKDIPVDVETIEIGNYISLNNEITIKDLGEAFDRALRLTKWSAASKDDSWTFDAIVHSTGMLVLRQWLTNDPFPRSDPRSRVKRLKHLVGLAPATFGSPQAQKGRSWLGAMVKGNRDLGPDFLNAGDLVLDGLELGSRYTWDLAQRDLVCDPPFYDQGPNTPYVAVFIGNRPYDGVAKLASSPGTDGTVRWAGCALNSRLVQLDFRRESKLVGDDGAPTRAKISKWADTRLGAPMLATENRNHGSILSDPDPDTVARVRDFLLKVNSDVTYQAWLDAAEAHSKDAKREMDEASFGDNDGGEGWQQFVVHVKDDHGDGVDDYNVQMFVGDDLSESDQKDFRPVPVIVDTYTSDASYRCVYVRLDDAMLSVGKPGSTKKVWVEIIATSGTKYLDYEAYYSSDPGQADASVKLMPLGTVVEPETAIPNLVKLDLTDLGEGARLFYPYTTTLVEIVLEREPTPLASVSDLFQFWQDNQTKNIQDS